MTTTREPKWDELIPLPSIFDPNTRITFLKSLLIEANPNYQHPRQHVNIKAAISMYESGKLNGKNEVLIAGGKVVNNEEALEGGLPVWSEGGSYHQFTQKASYPVDPELGGHTITIECRLLIAYGGQGLTTRVPVLYDTGSNVLSLFEWDIAAMATQDTLDQYLYSGFSHVLNADGVVSVFRKLWVEYRFCNPDNGTAWSAWMAEKAIIRPFTMDACRLSGSAMNDYYYFGTGPGTPTLSVASTKGGMSSQLN